MEQRLKEIGARVRKARLAKSYSQSQLAEILDVSPQYISNIEAGKNAMSIVMLMKIVDTLGVSADWVLRCNTQEAVQITTNEFNVLLKDCTPEERDALMRMLQGMKDTIRSIRHGDQINNQ